MQDAGLGIKMSEKPVGCLVTVVGSHRFDKVHGPAGEHRGP